jgi:hypothetical protein
VEGARFGVAPEGASFSPNSPRFNCIWSVLMDIVLFWDDLRGGKVHVGSLGNAEICYGIYLKEKAVIVEKTNLPLVAL